MLEIQPTKDVPVPFDLSDEQPKTHADSIAIAVNTADMIESLGGSLDFDAKDFAKAVELAKGETKPPTPKTITSPGIAKTLAVAVKQHDFQVFADVQQARNFVTNKLVAIADCGDPKLELKALELLGKHSDIGLFTERSEITVHHTSSKSLEESIKERVKRLMNADVVDVKSSLMDELDEVKESRRPAEKKVVDTIEDVEEKPEENNNS
jgi:neutral trehalase